MIIKSYKQEENSMEIDFKKLKKGLIDWYGRDYECL